MRKPAAKPEKEAKMPDALSLGTICALMEEQKQQVHNITQRAGIEPLARGVYPAARTLLAIKDYFKRQLTDVSSEEKQDRARKARNDADSSDIDLAEKRGLLMLKADAVQLWSDERIEMRRALQDSKAIPEKVKAEVVRILQSVKLGELP